MSNSNGWSLTGRLIAKHFGNLGDSISQSIASFDPETATQADRDQLQSTLMQTATKLAAARANFNKEHADVVSLRQLIESDSKAAATLSARMADGSISESAVNLFCDELEHNKAKLPQEIQEEQSAKDFMDELQQIVDQLSSQLSEFDRKAKAAIQTIESAKAKLDLEQMKLQHQSELSSLGAISTHSTALEALAKKAGKINAQAEGAAIVSQIGQKPIDEAKQIDDIRKSINPASVETAADRLQRLTSA
jgi:phosphomevalonate kinase